MKACATPALRHARPMVDDRRYRVPGGTYFFTVKLLKHKRSLLVEHVDLLREAVREVRRCRPFRIDTWITKTQELRGHENFRVRYLADQKLIARGFEQS